MSKSEELKIWVELGKCLKSIPNDLRSQNHTNYLAEVKIRIYDLIDDGQDMNEVQVEELVDLMKQS